MSIGDAMVYKLAVSAKAENNVTNAVSYYGIINVALVERFLADLNFTFLKIANKPGYYKYISNKRKNNLRCSSLKDFPFMVIFYSKQDVIIIVSVLHTHRKNKYI